jgi:elongation factor G
MHANKQTQSIFEAGDIGAAVGFKDIKTGDTLCDEKHYLRKYEIPCASNCIAIEPKTKADVDKMGMALAN